MYREEHEDALLHEVLLCLKALTTTELALTHLGTTQSTLFPALLTMLFSSGETRYAPSEFTTRGIITSLLFTYLSSAALPERSAHAKVLLSYLRDPEPKEEERPVNFVLEMRRERPYRVWCKEVVNVTKEVFWIFLHNTNVVSLPEDSSVSAEAQSNLAPDYPFMRSHFPAPRPPVAAAPYVGGVEWDATNYLASHLDVLNGITASLPTLAERNQLREELRVSGWEKCMGGTLRLCKEKFYAGVHAGLREWVAAALTDGWDVRDVRNGLDVPRSPIKRSPLKGKAEEAPRIDMPKLDFAVVRVDHKVADDGWL